MKRMKAFSLMIARLKSLPGCDKGVALIELALLLPLLILMFVGTISVFQYLLAIQKAEKVVNTVSDIVTKIEPVQNNLTQDQSIFINTMNELPSLVPLIMNLNTTWYIIVTNVFMPGGGASIAIPWRYCATNASTTTYTDQTLANTYQSTVSVSGNTLSVGGKSMNLFEQQEVIVTEIYSTYTPAIAANIVPTTLIYRSGIYTPRYIGGYTNADGSFVPTYNLHTFGSVMNSHLTNSVCP